MDWNQIITTLLGVLVIVGSMFRFFWGVLEKKFDSMDRKFEAILLEIKEVRQDIRNIDHRLSKLEGQDEERFRNKIELFVTKNQEKKKGG